MSAASAGGAYSPRGGIAGRVRRLSARLLARSPMTVALDRPIVSFTFDDFPKSALDAGGAILVARGWRATYYASAAYAGTTTHHGPMFDAADLAALLAQGHEIGCHTHDHLDGAATPPAPYMDDIARNAAALAELGLAAPMTSFAYPYGEATPALKRAVGARFAAARGIRPGVNRTGCDRTLLNAVPIDGGPAGIARAVAQARDAAQAPGWLIYYAHDVQDRPTPWGCTPKELEAVADAVAESGADVLTMGAALARIDGRDEDAAKTLSKNAKIA